MSRLYLVPQRGIWYILYLILSYLIVDFIVLYVNAGYYV